MGGHITECYLRYQEEKSRGGVGLTQFGGATAVSIENSFGYSLFAGRSFTHFRPCTMGATRFSRFHTR